MDENERYMAIMTDIFYDVPRQGPGSLDSMTRVIKACKGVPDKPFVLDLGCGTGTHTLELAQKIDGHVIAIEFIERFVDELRMKSRQLNLGDRIQAQVGDMSALDFQPNSFDLIWSEASAYSIGFVNALVYWHQFLKPEGYLAVSELVWLKDNPPEAIQAFWADEYPDMQSVEKVQLLFAQNGYEIVEQFTLPDDDWWLYYKPLEAKLPKLYEQYHADTFALDIIKGLEVEIDMRRRFSEWYGYQFFVGKKV